MTTIIISEYLSEMSDIILGSQGIVDKYIGDAIMAFWNAPLTLPHHATTACLVALQVQKRLGELRKGWYTFPEFSMKHTLFVNVNLCME